MQHEISLDEAKKACSQGIVLAASSYVNGSDKRLLAKTEYNALLCYIVKFNRKEILRTWGIKEAVVVYNNLDESNG